MLPLNSFRRPVLRHWDIYKKWYTTATKPEDQIFRESSTSNHNDLLSFLEYASRVEMDSKSTVYTGTHYEYTAQSSLERLGITLKRVGGRSDYGIDLLGTWNLPSIPKPMKVLVQCKARAAKPTPSEIRELEGAFTGAPSGWRGSGVLAMLVAQKEATKGVRDAMGRSRWPMAFVMCTGQGKILQMMWNRRAEEEGLLGVGVTLKYAEDDASSREVLLTWEGRTLWDNVPT
jgi:hypothetical protein